MIALQSLYSGSASTQASAIVKEMKTLKERLYRQVDLQVFQQINELGM